MKFIQPLFTLLITLSLTQCLSYDLSRKYVQQGNLLPIAKVQRLKIGMSKENVQQLLGDSLIQPLFNPNQFNYAYTWQKGSSPMVIKYATITFKDDKVIQIQHHP